MPSLCQKYIESREFVSSLDSMAAMLEESLSADFALEPNPLQSIAIVVYTCTRLWDVRPLKRMAQLARSYSTTANTWMDNFRLHYALVAAGEEATPSLIAYLRQPGEEGFRAATRIASLAYFLRDETLLYECVVSMRNLLNEQATLDPDMEWELEFGEAMYSALKCGKADLTHLCRTASRIGDSHHLSFVSTDVSVLQRSLRRDGTGR